MTSPMTVLNAFPHSKATRPAITFNTCNTIEMAVSTIQGVSRLGRPYKCDECENIFTSRDAYSSRAMDQERGDDDVEDADDEHDGHGDVHS